MVSLSPCLGAYLSVVGKCGLLSAGDGVGSCFWERGQERCHWKRPVLGKGEPPAVGRRATMVFQRRGLTDGLFPLREQPSFLSLWVFYIPHSIGGVPEGGCFVPKAVCEAELKCHVPMGFPGQSWVLPC